MSNMQFRFSWLKLYRFRPSWTGLFITACCITLFIRLGLWQYGKAELKQSLQATYDSYLHMLPLALPDEIENPEDWRYRQIKVTGEYVPQYQILLDNQVENERVGYHVITPLRIRNTQRLILVDRGWVQAPDSHIELPDIQTPAGEQDVMGQGWLPSDKFYTLEAKSPSDSAEWQTRWQNMDMKRYAALVPFQILPVVIRMDPASKAGGFVRNWVKPAERITTHIGYAYQWFGFAAAAFFIFIFVSFKKAASQ